MDGDVAVAEIAGCCLGMKTLAIPAAANLSDFRRLTVMLLSSSDTELYPLGCVASQTSIIASASAPD